MFGAILRSDGRDYGEISKGGLIFGAIVGILMALASLMVASETPALRFVLSLFGGFFGTFLAFIFGALFYDMVNYFIDA